MPLDKSGGKGAIGRNIKTEMGAGKPQKQAVAIALHTDDNAGKPKTSPTVDYVKNKLGKTGNQLPPQ